MSLLVSPVQQPPQSQPSAPSAPSAPVPRLRHRAQLTPQQRACLQAVEAAPCLTHQFSGRTVETLVKHGFIQVVTRADATLAERFWLYPSTRAHGMTVKPSRPVDDRWLYAQALRDAGHTLEEIGAALGLTRERVRQKTLRPLRRPRSMVDGDTVARLLATARRPDTMTLMPLLAIDARARQILIGFERWDAIKRLFAWRRTAPRRRRIGAEIHAAFVRLGRTPSLLELADILQVGPTAAGPTCCATFGSIEAAMRYAGVPHRSVRAKGADKFVTWHGPDWHYPCVQCGSRARVMRGTQRVCGGCGMERPTGRALRRVRGTHCLRGHEYTTIRSSGRRYCPVCQAATRDRRIAAHRALRGTSA